MKTKSKTFLPDDVAIRADDVWKRYRTGAIRGRTFTRDIHALISRMRGGKKSREKVAMDRSAISVRDTAENEWFWAVKGASFDVKKGETVVILGRNGAGKSSLLQILCQVTEADRGEIAFRGRYATLLQAGVGFNPELTGIENIFLNGSILGLTRDEISDRVSAIAEFSEISKFLKTPVKRYSSGMKGRLGFSVAAHLGAEIMILDEVFATGDRPFREKCIEKMKELAAGGTTVLLVTHIMEMLGDAVDRALFMQDGVICYDGDKETAMDYYLGNLSLPSPREGDEDLAGKVVSVPGKSVQLPRDPTAAPDEKDDDQTLREALMVKIASHPVQPGLYAELGHSWLRAGKPDFAYSCFRSALAFLPDGSCAERAELQVRVRESEGKLPPLDAYPLTTRRLARAVHAMEAQWPTAGMRVLEIHPTLSESLCSRYAMECEWVVADPQVCGLKPRHLPFAPKSFDVVFCHENSNLCKTWKDWEEWITKYLALARQGVAVLGAIGDENEATESDRSLRKAGALNMVPDINRGSDADIDRFADARNLNVIRVPVGGAPLESLSLVAESYAAGSKELESFRAVHRILHAMPDTSFSVAKAIRMHLFVFREE